jgi:hypothetical protein
MRGALLLGWLSYVRALALRAQCPRQRALALRSRGLVGAVRALGDALLRLDARSARAGLRFATHSGMSKPIPSIQKYMTTSPHTVEADQTHAHATRHLPVLRGGELVGMLTDIAFVAANGGCPLLNV